MSVRGAYDLLYDIGDIAADVVQASLGQPPLTFQGTLNATPNQVLTLPFNPGTFPAATTVPRILDYYFKQPYLHLYNLTIDRQLPWSSVLTVSYVGSRGHSSYGRCRGEPCNSAGRPLRIWGSRNLRAATGGPGNQYGVNGGWKCNSLLPRIGSLGSNWVRPVRWSCNRKLFPASKSRLGLVLGRLHDPGRFLV